MRRDNFWIDGEDAAEKGILLEKEIEFDAAEPDTETVSVPGRDGDLIYYTGAYKNVRGRASCFCLDKDVLFRMTEVNAWLMSRSGYRRLETRCEPHFFRMVRVMRGAKQAPHQNDYNAFEIEFDCQPYKFYVDGERSETFQAAGQLFGPTPFKSYPLIVVHGSGAGTVTINGATLSLTDCDEISLDCEAQDATRNGTNLNSTVSGVFPTLGKENSISFAGGVTSLTITPRWRTI